MELTAQAVDTSPSYLRVGLVLKYSKNGPIRFATVKIPWELLTWDVVREIGIRYDKLTEREPEDAPLF
jgi:hypothetical protein